MIQANELRIGNFVDLGGRFIKVGVRIIGDIMYSNNTGLSHGYKPIPLTEEILLKCGFERQEYNDYRHPVLIGTLTLYEGVAELHISDLYSVWANNLHQLQNLYFALCGEELEVKI